MILAGAEPPRSAEVARAPRDHEHPPLGTVQDLAHIQRRTLSIKVVGIVGRQSASSDPAEHLLLLRAQRRKAPLGNEHDDEENIMESTVRTIAVIALACGVAVGLRSDGLGAMRGTDFCKKTST